MMSMFDDLSKYRDFDYKKRDFVEKF